MNRDIRAAMLGDHEAAKRLTEAGVLLACPMCGKASVLHSIDNCKTVYAVCPACGAAQTDEAVEMVMERLEALYEDNSYS